MPAGREACIVSTKEKKKTNGQAEGENEEDRMATTACHAAEKTFEKHRRFDVAETKGEVFTADGATNEEKVNEATAGNETADEKGETIAFDAIDEEREQTSLASLL